MSSGKEAKPTKRSRDEDDEMGKIQAEFEEICQTTLAEQAKEANEEFGAKLEGYITLGEGIQFSEEDAEDFQTIEDAEERKSYVVERICAMLCPIFLRQKEMEPILSKVDKKMGPGTGKDADGRRRKAIEEAVVALDESFKALGDPQTAVFPKEKFLETMAWYMSSQDVHGAPGFDILCDLVSANLVNSKVVNVKETEMEGEPVIDFELGEKAADAALKFGISSASARNLVMNSQLKLEEYEALFGEGDMDEDEEEDEDDEEEEGDDDDEEDEEKEKEAWAKWGAPAKK